MLHLKILIHLHDISYSLHDKTCVYLPFSEFNYGFQQRVKGTSNILRGIFTNPSVINYSTIFDATTPIYSRGAFIFLSISSEKDPRVIKVVIIFSRNRIRKIFTKNHSEFSIRSYPHLCKQFNCLVLHMDEYL